MPKLALTDAQQNLVDTFKMQNMDDRALRIVDAAFRFRNAMAPSGVMDRKEATDLLFTAIDRVS